jgi:hypothetical protein
VRPQTANNKVADGKKKPKKPITNNNGDLNEIITARD